MKVFEVASKSINGRRNVKFALHEIFNSTEHYQENGISWAEVPTRQNMHTVEGMSIKAEFLDSERDMPVGHGLTGIENGKPVYQNAVVVGFAKKPQIEDVELNGKMTKVLTAESEIDEFVYPNFIKWLEEQKNNNSKVTGSVEISSKVAGSPIVYDGGFKEKGRVPLEYDYSGYAVISIKPADNAAVMLELNNAKNNKSQNKEDINMGEKELKEQIETVIQKVSEINAKISDIPDLASKNTEIEKLNNKIVETNATVEQLQKLLDDVKKERDEAYKKADEAYEQIHTLKKMIAEQKLQEKISELNNALAVFSEEDKECAKDLIENFHADPQSIEINSIIDKIKVAKFDKFEIEKSIAEQNTKQKQNKPNDIYGDISEKQSEKDGDEGFIY